MVKTFTISIYSENNVGLLNRISAIFLKRHINIESLTTSQSEINDVFRFIIIVKLEEEGVKKLINQIHRPTVLHLHTHDEGVAQHGLRPRPCTFAANATCAFLPCSVNSMNSM